MIETTRPELVAYQEERLAKFVGENEKLNKGQIVFAGDSITEFFALKKYFLQVCDCATFFCFYFDYMSMCHQKYHVSSIYDESAQLFLEYTFL